MNKFAKAGQRAGIVLSITAAALIAPDVILAGPGCMNNQGMAPGYHSYRIMRPHMAYGQRTPYRYQMAPAPYGRLMPAPYNRSMTAVQTKPADVGDTATALAVGNNAGQSIQADASSKSMPAGETVTVRIVGMRFEPAYISVKPGTTVTWVHESQMPHTISGNTDGLRSSTLYKGQEYSHTFNATGNYNYFCQIHPSMTGSVVVEEAAEDS